ncbi:hypothetical protein ICW40_08575 [Actinotalea ferrariae]|uniref:hypothetical protein n=1 Tax=Actinotalea ferrariae TaxID=1386098 RepID=UPI001C8B5620|nr:hypothetical protein [Actinotalea ferrariae]MBX9244864.1 hypothetical protein [Actinotalea ferrariae]
MSTDDLGHDDHPADGVLDDADLRVLAGLRRVLDAADPVPDDLVERSLFALSLEALHTQVMELQLLEVPELAVRGEATVEARTITFTAEPVTVMISLSVSPSGGVRVDGWAAPATRYEVELLRPGGSVRTESDDDGSFVLADVPPGPASLVLRHGSGTGVSTPVIEL